MIIFFTEERFLPDIYISRGQPFESKVENFQPKFFLVIKIVINQISLRLDSTCKADLIFVDRLDNKLTSQLNFEYYK